MLVVGANGPVTSINVSQQIGANILTIRAGLESALTPPMRCRPG